MVLADSRGESIEAIAAGTLDVLVMGGGINGAGILRDLALRNKSRRLRLALVDRGHFSSGTSGRNSQLIHGGLRYLKNLEFKLVSEALAERSTLLRTAPHLVEPLAFLIPMPDLLSAAFYESGLFLYDFLGGKNRIARHTHLSSNEVQLLEPRMRKFAAGARFFDCRVQSARLVLLNLREAESRGALAANYVSVEGYEKSPDGNWHVHLMDQLSGKSFETSARTLVNATGAWSREGSLRLVRGSHIVLPRIGQSENAVSYFGKDGRIIFFIPWGRRHAYTLVGTTDVDHQGGPDQVRISPDEVRYLLRVIEEVFPGTGPHDPICAYSSLRPLVRDESSSATKTSREHRIWADERGLIHVSGGKYTTYRLMSEEASDLVALQHPESLDDTHATATTPLCGNTPQKIRDLLESVERVASEYAIDSRDLEDAIGDYGVDTTELLAKLPVDPSPIPRLESAQIAFAAKHEWVQHLSDLLFVSTYWGYERRWTPAQLLPYAENLGRHLDWTPERVTAEIELTMTISDQPQVLSESETALT